VSEVSALVHAVRRMMVHQCRHSVSRWLQLQSEPRTSAVGLTSQEISAQVSADSRNSPLADMEFPTGGHQISP
jgi:hypothetical protein